ncbi:MAG: hypothetical protein IKI58_10765 [Oscillospiraceae bacterium]|nr:hypothetical protein [Oscillospiraceae bacterium]
MKKQLRILIGDTGGSFAVAMASAFCREGDWAVVRQQTEPELTEAIRKEHPDLLILDGCMIPLNPIAFVRQLRETSDLTVMALIHRQNSFLEKELTELGVLCRRFPENPTELRREIRKHFGTAAFSGTRIDLTGMEIRLTRLLQSVGVPFNLQGFHFLRCAIRHAMSEPYCSGCMMNRIYPAVAEDMNSTPARVERSIRHAITHAWETVQPENMPYPFRIHNHRMTNSEFIALAVEYMRSGIAEQICG